VSPPEKGTAPLGRRAEADITTNQPPRSYPTSDDWNNFVVAVRHMDLDEIRALDRLLSAFPNTRIGRFEGRVDP
jgi:hypothetical protein